MRFTLVSALTPDVTQQIHSLRASGVISFQSVVIFTSLRMAFLKSFGNLWTVPSGSLVIKAF